MEDNTNNNMPKQSMDPTKSLYEKLISEAYKYKVEEREMALDRYRRADEQMDDASSFVLLGKNAVDYLKLAATSSDAIANLAKEIKSIVYKDDASAAIEVNFNDQHKRAIIDAIKDDEKKIEDENLEDNTLGNDYETD